MSSEVYSIVRKLDPDSLATQLIIQCAPLIAGLKASNLLKVSPEYEEDVRALFSGTQIRVVLLIRSSGKSIFLLYRPDMLKGHIRKKECRRLLHTLGYTSNDLTTLITQVRSKYQAFTEGNRSFPHELGILLGYPPEDVEGYLKDRGKNALYTGYWQVYKDPAKKIRIFESYEQAREQMARLAFGGMELLSIMNTCERRVSYY